MTPCASFSLRGVGRAPLIRVGKSWRSSRDYRSHLHSCVRFHPSTLRDGLTTIRADVLVPQFEQRCFYRFCHMGCSCYRPRSLSRALTVARRWKSSIASNTVASTSTSSTKMRLASNASRTLCHFTFTWFETRVHIGSAALPPLLFSDRLHTNELLHRHRGPRGNKIPPCGE